MQDLTRWSNFVSLGTLAACTGLFGVVAVTHTPIGGIGARFGSGESQRLYETRFDEAMPLRDDARALWAAVKLGVLGEAAEGAILGADGWLFTSEEFAAPVEGFDLLREIRAAHDGIVDAGGILLVVVVPDKARMMRDRLPHPRSAPYQARYDRILGLLAAEGITVLDARPALQPIPGAPAPYLRGDTHWSPQGAQRVAAAIADTIGLEPSGGGGFSTRPTGNAPFVGDLSAFVDTGRWRPLVGPRDEQIATYETQSRGGPAGLFDDLAIEVALVGTSFSARPAFHFEGFLRSSLDADLINYAQIGRGPFRPMQRFLAGLRDAETPPKFVIWELPERYVNPWSLL